MNKESLEAYDRIKPFLTEGRKKVLNALIEFLKTTQRFPTCKEIANSMGDKTPNDISGRLTELAELGIIYKLPSEGKGARYDHKLYIPGIYQDGNIFTIKLYYANMVGDTLDKRKKKTHIWVEITRQSLAEGGYKVITVLEAYDCRIMKYMRLDK